MLRNNTHKKVAKKRKKEINKPRSYESTPGYGKKVQKKKNVKEIETSGIY